MSSSIDPRSARWSALVEADTQFDLDLADILDQYPDGAVRGAGGAVVAGAEPPATGAADATDAGETPRPTPFGAVVAAAAAAERFPAPSPGATPAVTDPPATAFAVPDAPNRNDTSVDVPVPLGGAVAPTTVDPGVESAVNPPTSVHSVFVTPPAGVPVVGPILPEPPAPVAAGRSDRRNARRARRRSRTLLVLAGVLAVALVAAGIGLAVATRDGGDGDEAAVAAPGQSVAAPPADATKPADDDATTDDASADGAVVDPAALEQAAGAVTTFLSVRGAEAERAVSSQGGRAELDAVLAATGATSVQGAPACSAAATAATFACVVDTDQGPITFTVGADADDPASSGFEVIGAAA